MKRTGTIFTSISSLAIAMAIFAGPTFGSTGYPSPGPTAWSTSVPSSAPVQKIDHSSVNAKLNAARRERHKHRPHIDRRRPRRKLREGHDCRRAPERLLGQLDHRCAGDRPGGFGDRRPRAERVRLVRRAARRNRRTLPGTARCRGRAHAAAPPGREPGVAGLALSESRCARGGGARRAPPPRHLRILLGADRNRGR